MIAKLIATNSIYYILKWLALDRIFIDIMLDYNHEQYNHWSDLKSNFKNFYDENSEFY